MVNLFLYAVSVLFLGSSWLAVRWQVGLVPEEQSVGYRFACAAAIMFVWAALRGDSLRFSWRQHLWLALMGATMFCFNFFQVYNATGYTTTGLIALVFSTTSAFVAILGTLFLGQRVSGRLWIGIALGIAGVACIFWPEIEHFSLEDEHTLGLLLAVGGTMTFAVGTTVSGRNQLAGFARLPMTAWAMAYGSFFLLTIATIRGAEFTIDLRTPYLLSFGYLTVFCTVVAFAAFLTLVTRIGPARTAYSTVMWPVVALFLSTLFEDYNWSVPAIAGVALVLAGNLLVLSQRPAPVRPAIKEEAA
jgi:drug/metabolite transporter (DMT)-like permease